MCQAREDTAETNGMAVSYALAARRYSRVR
jgi:hypothetical protein